MLVAAAAPSLPVVLAVLPFVGAASVTLSAGVNSALQLAVDPAMRGRVMALFAIVFMGSTPVGGPLVGSVSQAAGPRAGLALGGVAAVLAGAGAHLAFTRARRTAAAAAAERPARLRPRGSGASSAPARTRRGHTPAESPRLPV
jgi:MFS family permease